VRSGLKRLSRKQRPNHPLAVLVVDSHGGLSRPIEFERNDSLGNGPRIQASGYHTDQENEY
jgi:hypothetical protein